ncbi:MAG: hypothetical protein GXZ04_05995, partial [Clostridiales bacterium]|nr:hypothetical protein [Clostridiales bacterium]
HHPPAQLPAHQNQRGPGHLAPAVPTHGRTGARLAGIPSSGGDLRALYKNKPNKLLSANTYFIDIDLNGKIYLIKQVYPAHGDYLP